MSCANCEVFLVNLCQSRANYEIKKVRISEWMILIKCNKKKERFIFVLCSIIISCTQQINDVMTFVKFPFQIICYREQKHGQINIQKKKKMTFR